MPYHRRKNPNWDRRDRVTHHDEIPSYGDVDYAGIIFLKTGEYKKCKTYLDAIKISCSINGKNKSYVAAAFRRGDGFFVMF